MKFTKKKSDRQSQQKKCPPKCGTSGKCYGKAYFSEKADKGNIYLDDKCPWLNKLRKRIP